MGDDRHTAAPPVAHTEGVTDQALIQEQEQRIRELNEQILRSAARGGTIFLDAYEKRLRAIAANGPLR